MENDEGDLSLFDRVEKPDIAQSLQGRRHQSGAHVDDGDSSIGCRQCIDDPHLIGDRGGIDDFTDLAMEMFKRSLRHFGIESARLHMMGGEIIEQGARDCRLADAALVRPDQNQCWFSHDATLAMLLLASPRIDLYTDDGKLESLIAVASRDDDAFAQ